MRKVGTMSECLRDLGIAFAEASAGDIVASQDAKDELVKRLVETNRSQCREGADSKGNLMLHLDYPGGYSVVAWHDESDRLTSGHITQGNFGFFGRTAEEMLEKLFQQDPIAPPPKLGDGQYLVCFREGDNGSVLTKIGRKIAFAEKNGPNAQKGEKWIVEIAGENPNKTVYFLRLVRKIS